MATKQYDITALGEVLVDFTYSGLSKSGMRLFEQNPGGAVANVLCCAAKSGLSTAFIGKVGRDMHGEFLVQVLQANGIDTKGVVMSDEFFTTLAFVALSQTGERAFSFARRPGADTCLCWDEVNKAIIANTSILHIGSLSLTDEPARSATYEAVKFAKAAGAIIAYDPNYRAGLWASEGEAMAQMRAILPFVDMVKLSDAEMALLTGHVSPEAAAKALLDGGVSCVAVTLGKDGALVCAKNGLTTVPGFKVQPVDTTGAGDAFWGGFLAQFVKSKLQLGELLTDDLARFARYGNAAAALCVTRRGAIPAMPTADEINCIMDKNDRQVF